ncbi:MAG: methyltransferase [Chloroflexi bacterium]|nr:methyltransferase [Chloroflexota bacterium]
MAKDSHPPDEAAHRAIRARLAQPPVVELPLPGRTLRLTSAWGLFSAKAIDEGTALLLGELVALPPPARALDFGCGYGALGLALAALWPDCDVELIDKDVEAVEACAANIAANGLTNAQASLSPGFRDAPPGPYDLIVSNLPAQAGNEALDAILLGAWERLRPGGSLVVVSVTGLRRYVRRRLEAVFGNYHKARQGPRHTVAQGVRAPTNDAQGVRAPTNDAQGVRAASG